jgi:oligoendopeptidase F
MTADTLPKRSDVPVELTWDLTSIYATDAAWEADFARVSGMLPEIRSYAGKLNKTGKALLSALNLRDTAGQILGKLSCYANMRLHEDTTSSQYQAFTDRVSALGSQLAAATAFMTPEILAIDPKRLKSLMARNKGLRVYAHQFDELDRERPHVRSHEVEALLAEVSEVTGAPERIYDLLTDADFKLPLIADKVGKELQLSQGNYVARFLASRDRGERERAFNGMLGAYRALRNTIAATYAAQVKGDIFRAKARNYGSCIEHALGSINVPVSVYDTLVETVHKNIPTLNRYLALRKRILGVDELHMYDLYVPIVDEVEYKIVYAKAKAKVLEALAPLGKEYVAALSKGLDSRWADVVETQNKRSGAYSWGSYGTEPFMLLNWQDSMDSMFTLAHEAGHSMHSFFTRKTQPYQYGDYTLFVAEVASTCNEALLTHFLLQETTDVALRRYIINHALEGFRTTLFRQTLFAEFEREAHARAEAGEALTPDLLCEIFKALNEKYYGGVVKVDDMIDIEWARIPHFYSSFYVYQYATGISAATALAKQITTEGAPAVARYLKFLSSGSSDYSINLLKAAGVDLSTPAPIQQALDTFAEYLDEFEKLA